MYSTTISLLEKTLTTIVTPSSGKELSIKYLTFNVDVDLFEPLELYIGSSVLYNLLCIRAGILYGFNLNNVFFRGGINNQLKVISPVTATINLNIIYEES
jgi:hypothetical protein